MLIDLSTLELFGRRATAKAFVINSAIEQWRIFCRSCCCRYCQSFGEEDRPKAASEDQGVMGAHFIRVGRGRGAVYDWNPLDILQNLCLIDKNSPFYYGGDKRFRPIKASRGE